MSRVLPLFALARRAKHPASRLGSAQQLHAALAAGCSRFRFPLEVEQGEPITRRVPLLHDLDRVGIGHAPIESNPHADKVSKLVVAPILGFPSNSSDSAIAVEARRPQAAGGSHQTNELLSCHSQKSETSTHAFRMLEHLTSPLSKRRFRIMETDIQDFQVKHFVSTKHSVSSPDGGGHGGARAGAGRPLGKVDRFPRVPAAMKESFQAQFKREMRAFASEFFTAYKKAISAGDSKILVDAANRLMGRPVTSVELSGPGGQPIRLQAAAAVALALSDPAQMAALEAFSRAVMLPGEDDGDSEEASGELPEAIWPEVPEAAPQTIISCEPVAERPQPVDNAADNTLGTDFADWLDEK